MHSASGSGSSRRHPMAFRSGSAGDDSDRHGKRVMADSDVPPNQPYLPRTESLLGDWFTQVVESLIRFRRELHSQFNTGGSKPELWKIISTKMRESGFDWAPSMCAQAWGDLVANYYQVKRESGPEGLIDASYEEMVQYFTARKRIPPQRESRNPEFPSAWHFNATGNEQPEANSGRGLNSELDLFERSLNPAQNLVGSNEASDALAANGASADHLRGGQHVVRFVRPTERVITVVRGNNVKRISIDGSPEAIKEVIRSAFSLRSRRSFWLEDDDGIARTIDRAMPLRNYTLKLDEGLTLKIYLDNAADESPVQADKVTFYAEEDFLEFLRRYGFVALTDITCRKNVHSIGDLHHGEVYQGYKAPAN